MSNTIYNADYSESLPEALKKDPKMVALATATAAALLNTSGVMDSVLIYARIDELPEELVDILAYDMHVDWYDYSYPLESKRDLVKNSVEVHKKMGTKYAIEKALSSLFPESEVEEWFKYGGEPGHFHIVLDVTNQKITADYAAIIRATRLYKRLSAHMDELTYQGQIHGRICTNGKYYKYKVPVTGNMRNSPVAGTRPYRSTVFVNPTAQVDAETTLNASTYTSIPAGRIRAGTYPHRSPEGINTQAEDYAYRVKACGSSRRL